LVDWLVGLLVGCLVVRGVGNLLLVKFAVGCNHPLHPAMVLSRHRH